ncbi:MAG: DUF4382 domain-containing protein [Nitrososphaerales archaeon]
MNTKNKVATSGAIAAVIAVSLIAAVLSLGILSSTTTGVFGATTTTGNSAKSGTLAVLMTDPPTVPTGVTAVYITYVDLGVHVSNAGNQSGWHELNTQGRINLMSVINATQTVASVNIASGTFNALAFNITSAIVTYNGQNYTADMVYQEHTLFVPIVGGITVSSGQTSAAVIDLTPTVLLLGNTTNPTFAFMPAAKGYTIPAQSTTTMHLQVGERDDIYGAPWWVAIEHNSHFQLTGVSLTPSTLSITVSNTGNSTIDFRAAAITSTTSVQGGFKGEDFPATAAISEFFVVESNGSLVAITAYGHEQATSMLGTGGYLLKPGTSATFSYSGNITLGILQQIHIQPTQQIVQSQQYVVTLLGNGMFAQTDTAASA